MTTMPAVAGTEGNCEALASLIARALGYPKRSTSAVTARRITVQATWNGIGDTPVGWTKRPTTTWFLSSSSCIVPIPDAMATELAAAPAQARLTPVDRASLTAALAARSSVTVDSYGLKCPGSKQIPIANVPSFGIAWDGWPSDHTRGQTSFAGTGNSPNNIWADYAHRRPTGWATFDLWNFPTDATIDVQARSDWRLQDISGAIDAIIYDWYPPPSCFAADPANIPDPSYLMLGFEAHRLSAYKSLVKFGLMIDPSWWSYNAMPISLPDSWARTASYRAHLIAAITDSSYFTVLGHPVIGVYGYANLAAGSKTTWLAEVDAINTACISAVGVAPYWVVQDYNQTTATDMQSRGARWKTSYGPNPGLPAYNANLPTVGALSQYPFLTNAVWDRARWSSSGGGIKLSAPITPNLDGRPRGAGSRSYTDDPTMLELIEHCNGAHAAYQSGVGKAEIMSVYSVSEFSEGGTISTTDQDGSKFPDALRIARGVSSPTSYVERIDAHSSLLTKTGTWTYVQQLGTTYHNSDVMRSGGTGAKLSFAHYQITKLEVALERGPDRGIAKIYLDGVLQGTVDCYSALAQAPSVLWSSSTLTAGMHSVDVEESGTKNASSSANTIGFDYVRSTVSLVYAG
jgi:hypothetical protein